MSAAYVERTCIHLDGGVAEAEAQGHGSPALSSPLSDFRNERAYVLLGDAGIGKSTEFRNESEALGGRAVFCSARDFVALEIRLEWRDKTLFIDGLDEIRAGSADGRTALDQIRNRLDQLGWPNYRLSCREADWLGSNDRRNLENATPDGTVAVLRLNPLSESAKRELVAAYLQADDTSEFFVGAEQRGLGGMLDNPLTLELLTGAFAQGRRSWPASRRETFELACERMAREHNDEHNTAIKTASPIEDVLSAAGELCAIQLLAGIEGFSLGPIDSSPAYAALDSLQSHSADFPNQDAHLRRHALGTKLFSAAHGADATAGWPRMMPLHRQIAEFLGGRYLARLVELGLPARRVVALMVSPHDGRVVTSLRGLSAWLAAHSTEALDRLIDADPVGIGLYGDVADLNGEQKRQLLRALAMYAAEGPLLRNEWLDSRTTSYRDTTAWAFRSIVDAGTVESLRSLLHGLAEEPASNRMAEFLLRVLAETEKEKLSVARPLVALTLAIAREPKWSPQTRRAALDAFIHLETERRARDDALVALLTDIKQRRLTDPDDDLAGIALRKLYPCVVTPAAVWSYLGIRTRENYYGAFDSFWSRAFVNLSSAQDAANALDALWAELSDQSPRSGIDGVLRQRAQDMVPVGLLAKAIKEVGDSVDISRLYGWLAAAATCGRDIQVGARQRLQDSNLQAVKDLDPQALEQTLGADAEEEIGSREFADPAGPIREWLEQRPDTQRHLYLEWLRMRRDDGPLRYRAWHTPTPLLFSRLPCDPGRWCLEQALALEANDPNLATDILAHVVRRQVDDSTINDGLTLAVVREMTNSSPLLSAELQRLLSPSSQDAEDAAFEAEMCELESENERNEREYRQQWIDHIRDSLQALSDGSFRVDYMDHLARIYFGHRHGSDQDTSGRERIMEFLQGDRQATNAVVDALAAAVFRAELPTVDETISLNAESKYAWAAWPLFASLELVECDEPDRLDRLDAERRRRVIATYFCAPRPRGHQTPWLERWLADDSDLVNDVLVRCANGDIRAGCESSPALNELAGLGFNEETKHQIRLRVLKSFPTAAPRRQLRLLDSLLFDVIGGSQTDGIRDLIDAKLAAKSLTVAQRARWLATAVFLFEGRYAERLAEFAARHPAGTRCVAEFLDHDDGPRWGGESHFSAGLTSEALVAFVKLLGRVYPPIEPHGPVTAEINSARWTEGFIWLLASRPEPDVSDVLHELELMPQLSAWSDALRLAREEQGTIRRNAEYHFPTVADVQQTLSGGVPTNSADLAALLLDRLDDIAEQMRGAPGDPWRPYWNEDSHGRPDTSKSENSCRDSLLFALQQRLRPLQEVEATREGSYASAKRADIRLSCSGFNVPIEIKRESHRDLWNAMRDQLIGQYTTDPATDGYGIYLVLWFGGAKMPTPSSGRRPSTPGELRELLEQSLSIDEARKISVRVIDVTKPGGCSKTYGSY